MKTLSFQEFIAEHWQWLNKSEESTEDFREYRCTLDELLSWAVGLEWSEDPEWMLEQVLLEDEWLDESEAIGYHQLFKRSADREIEVAADEQDNGQVWVHWELDGLEFGIFTQDWPFADGEEEVTEEEAAAVRRVTAQLAGDPTMREVSQVEIIDWVQWAVREQGQPADQLTAAGFKSWLDFQRYSAN